MKRTLALILSLLAPSCFAAFTEFYVQTTGDNLNSGSTTNAASPFSYAGGTFVRATGVFTPAAGNPQSDGVANGMWASIYTTSGATNATFVALITNVTTTTIQVSLQAIVGAANTVSESAAASTCKVGGAWLGPNTNILNSAAGFPLDIIASTATNAWLNSPRVNFRVGVYPVTNAITINNNGPFTIQGYTTTPGDGGRFTIDGTFTGTGYTIINTTASFIRVVDGIFQNNGTTSGGTTACLALGGVNDHAFRCTVSGSRGSGISIYGNYCSAVQCEAYGNMTANASGQAGMVGGSGSIFVDCVAHDNVGGNQSVGFYNYAGGSIFNHCIAYNNSGDGFQSQNALQMILLNCDSYSNAANGLNLADAANKLILVRNCNFLRNKLYGITSASAQRLGRIASNGFGFGTVTNYSGDIGPNLASVVQVGNFAYASGTTPWVDPANGNFTITSASSVKAWQGYESFIPTNTLSYPTVGASVPTNSPGAGSSSPVTTSHSFVR